MRRPRRDLGMVTAELAVAIPVVALVLALCLAGISAALDQVRCIDAARLGSRAAARGDSPGAVRDLALAAAPPGAAVSVATSRGEAVVTVEARAGAVAGLLGWQVSATGRTPVEATRVEVAP